MDWGCWREISTQMLPHQAFLSHVAHRRLEDAKREMRAHSFSIPDLSEYELEFEDFLENRLFPFQPGDVEQEMAKKEAMSENPSGILTFLCHLMFEPAKKQKAGRKPRGGTRVI